jgi:hypothetical protein
VDYGHSGTPSKHENSFSIFKGDLYSLRIVVRLAKDDVEAQLKTQLNLLLGDVDEPLPERGIAKGAPVRFKGWPGWHPACIILIFSEGKSLY